MLRVVSDPTGLFARGAEFVRIQVAASLRLGTWPPGLKMRDLEDDTWYVVAPDPGRQNRERQCLESLGGTVRLVARRSSNSLVREVVDGQ